MAKSREENRSSASKLAKAQKAAASNTQRDAHLVCKCNYSRGFNVVVVVAVVAVVVVVVVTV